MRELLLMFVIACAATLASAQTAPVHPAPSSYEDPALEARVMAVAEELRCLVCQNETIAASHADLAVDLRKQIRNKLREGQSPQQILDFMAARYGDFVLYRPRLTADTLLLWAGPFVLLIVAAAALVLNIRRRRAALVARELTPAEAARARALLDEPSASP